VIGLQRPHLRADPFLNLVFRCSHCSMINRKSLTAETQRAPGKNTVISPQRRKRRKRRQEIIIVKNRLVRRICGLSQALPLSRRRVLQKVVAPSPFGRRLG
jgi:hypothetical protein